MVLIRSQIQNGRIADSDFLDAQPSSEPIFDSAWDGEMVFERSTFDKPRRQRNLIARLPPWLDNLRNFHKSRSNLFFLAWLALIWFGALGYLHIAKPSYSAHFKIILPGAGSVSSVNITDIGQATSNASSPFSSSSLSPTVTYKNLIMSSDIIAAAAKLLGTPAQALPVPKVKLTDETSFILVEMTGNKPEEAQRRAIAIQDAFFSELERLRLDETKKREDSTSENVQKYADEVEVVRRKINLLQARSGLTSIEQYNMMVSGTETLKAKIAENESALAKIEASEKSLKTSLNIAPAFIFATMKIHADPEFVALADATGKAESDLAEVSAQYGSNHPKVVDAKAKFIGSQQKMIARAAQVTGLSARKLASKLDFSSAGQRSGLLLQLVNLETEREGLDSQLSVMKTQVARELKSIGDLAKTVSQLEMLNRDYKLAEAIFTSALGRITTSKTDIFASYPMAQVAESAALPSEPNSPSRASILGGAALATLISLLAFVLGALRKPIIEKFKRKMELRNAFTHVA